MEKLHWIIPLLLILGSITLTYLLLNWFRKLVDKYVFLRSRVTVANRWSSNWKPNIGGTAFFILYLTSQLHFLLKLGTNASDSILSGMIAVTVGYLLGLADDHYRIRPLVKLIFQGACSTILILGGVCIHFFDYPIADWLLTYIWIVGLMNSINMLDNMDGITASVSLAIFIWAILFISNINTLFFIEFQTLYVISSTMIGFLILNFFPAKIFMGDKGSQLLGIYLSYISIQYFWNVNQFIGKNSGWFQQGIVPILLFLIPILDTSFVTIKRISQGTSPAVGGKDHTTHHWYYCGLSQRQIAILYFILTITSGFLAYGSVFIIKTWQIYYSIFYVFYVALITIFFLWAYQNGAKNIKHK